MIRESDFVPITRAEGPSNNEVPRAMICGASRLTVTLAMIMV